MKKEIFLTVEETNKLIEDALKEKARDLLCALYQEKLENLVKKMRANNLGFRVDDRDTCQVW